MSEYMNLREWRDIGFLQEANRLFFHPHGQALAAAHVREPRLAVSLPDEEEATLRALIADAQRDDDLTRGDGGRRRVDDLSRCLDGGTRYEEGDIYLVGVKDARDDDEGIVFADGDPMNAGRAQRVAAERERHRQARIKLFESNSDIEPPEWVES